MKNLLLKVLIIAIAMITGSHLAHAETAINIPDANFKKYLTDNGFDKNGDGIISQEEAAKAKSILITTNMSIASIEGIQYFTNLTTLWCTNNQLTQVDLSKNTKLEDLDLLSNKLTSIDVSACTELDRLRVSENSLTTLDVSKNAKIEILDFDYNSGITSIDLSNILGLKKLSCRVTGISSIDLSKAPNLTYLDISGDKISTLDISRQGSLTYLGAITCTLTSLDLRNNQLLEKLYCPENKLKALNLTHNINLIEAMIGCQKFDYTHIGYDSINVELGDAPKAALKNLEESGDGIMYKNRCIKFVTTQNLDIPDANFKAYLVSKFDTNGDKEISTAEAIGVSSISCRNKSIRSFAGIEYFKNLMKLDIGQNIFYNACLDLTNNTKLTYVSCDGCALKALKITNCYHIQTLFCNGNAITNLDVSSNTELVTLVCYNNLLSELYLGENKSLNQLNCSKNILKLLIIKGLTNLATIDCSTNYLTSLDVRTCAALTNLNCSFNELRQLDLSYSTALTTLSCHANRIAFVNLAPCSKITKALIGQQRVFKTDDAIYTHVKLGTLAKTVLPDLNAKGAINEKVYMDSIITFADAKFKAFLTATTQKFDITGDGEISKGEAASATTVNCNVTEISTVDELKYFTNLDTLKLRNTNVKKLDVSSNFYISYLTCLNGLTSFTLGKKNYLTYLNCIGCKLTTLDLSQTPELDSLFCYRSSIKSLDLSKCPKLLFLWSFTCRMSYLDLSYNTALKTAVVGDQYDDSNVKAYITVWLGKLDQSVLPDINVDTKNNCRITLASNGVESPNGNNVKITAGRGFIEVTGANRVEVYNLNGAMISNNTRCEVPAGIYIVRADNKTMKVAVK
jgi:Leucine-rich repeat (LRR) protein